MKLSIRTMNFLGFSLIRHPHRHLALASKVLWPSVLLAGRFLGFVL